MCLSYTDLWVRCIIVYAKNIHLLSTLTWIKLCLSLQILNEMSSYFLVFTVTFSMSTGRLWQLSPGMTLHHLICFKTTKRKLYNMFLMPLSLLLPCIFFRVRTLILNFLKYIDVLDLYIISLCINLSCIIPYKL